MTQQQRPIGVLVVDDHAIVRDGIATIVDLQEDMEVLGQVGCGREACQAYDELSPDVLLLDLRLPDFDGPEVIRRIRRRDSALKALVLTTFDGDEDIYRSLRAGACGYLLKDSPREELLEAIRAVYLGQQALPSLLADKVASRLGEPSLTNRELEVLVGLAGGKPNRGIADDLGISEGTVKTHVNSVLHKLDAGSRTEAVVKAVRRGFLRI